MGVKSAYVVCENCDADLRYTAKLIKCRRCSQVIPLPKLEEAKRRLLEEERSFKFKKFSAILKKSAASCNRP
jgi:hypothetical protein